MDLHVDGAHTGQKPPVSGRQRGREWSKWETLTTITGTLGRWQNSPVQTAASTKVIQSKETEWENNAIKPRFDFFNLQCCCCWLYRSVTCWSWGGGGTGHKSVPSERWLEKSWQRPMKTTHHICLVELQNLFAPLQLPTKVIQINKNVQDHTKSGPHMQIQHPDKN